MAGSTFTGPLKIRKPDNTKVTFVDVNGNLVAGTSIALSDGDYIADDNGNELIKAGVTASAVNELSVVNAATGAAPTLKSTGGDTNVGLDLSTKGTGTLIFWSGDKARELFQLTDVSSSVNFVEARGAAAGGQVSVRRLAMTPTSTSAMIGRLWYRRRSDASPGTAVGAVSVNNQMLDITTESLSTAAGAHTP